MSAADDSTEAYLDANAGPRAGGSHDNLVLPPAATDWLGARIDSIPREAVIAVAVQSGRWLLRLDHGATGSSIELPVREAGTVADLANAVRRWARASGHVAQVEGAHAGEVRVAITRADATRS